jgi:hypothetical protein
LIDNFINNPNHHALHPFVARLAGRRRASMRRVGFWFPSTIDSNHRFEPNYFDVG